MMDEFHHVIENDGDAETSRCSDTADSISRFHGRHRRSNRFYFLTL